MPASSCAKAVRCHNTSSSIFACYLRSWSIFCSIFASRSFMALSVDASSWPVEPSAPGRLALLGVFGIDTSDLVLSFGCGVGIYVCIPRFADLIRCGGLLEYCQRPLKA